MIPANIQISKCIWNKDGADAQLNIICLNRMMNLIMIFDRRSVFTCFYMYDNLVHAQCHLVWLYLVWRTVEISSKRDLTVECWEGSRITDLYHPALCST